MIRSWIHSIIVLLLAVTAVFTSHAATVDEHADSELQEILSILKANISGVSEAELNEAAISGLVDRLSPKVRLIPAGGVADVGDALLAQSTAFENGTLYLRVGRVSTGLASVLQQSIGAISATNQLKGLVIDLRYAGGDDYDSVSGIVSLFLRNSASLFDWGQGMVLGRPVTGAVNVPVVVLVNNATTRAAEVLAGTLRKSGSALVLGNATAGAARMMKQFTLKNGDRLHVATGLIRFGDGSTLAQTGMEPDIRVHVKPEDEILYFADPYLQITRGAEVGTASTSLVTGTNQVSRRPRFGEAELVRERRGILDSNVAVQPASTEPEVPVVQDPVLARALDVLKGLAVVRNRQ